jgi:hypothetical protein
VALEDQATFICGHPKSGTSLLRGMLDSHPQLIVFPEETKFFRRVFPEAAGLGPEAGARVVGDRILQIFHWSPSMPAPGQAGFLDRDYTYLSHAPVEEVYRRRVAGWTGESGRLLAAAILAYGEASGRLGPQARRWVEKSPYNERYADRIFEWWPEARCLHVVRDPRDNYASYRRKHPDWTPAAFADSWRRSTVRGWRNQRKFGGERYHIIRYEDLVLETEEAITDIVRFLGIEDASTLRLPTRDGRTWKGNSMFGEDFEGISQRPVGRYAEALAESSRRELERQLEPEMTRLAYRFTPPLTLREKISGRVARMKWTWRSLRSALRGPSAAPPVAPGRK